jgi:hypothetical protein
MLLDSLLDWQGAGWYYQAAFERLFRLFWTGYGWGGYFVQDPGAYTFVVVTILAGIGSTATIWRKRGDLDWTVCLFFALALAAVWGAALVRGLGGSLVGYIYIPSARYGYPVIAPTLLVLCVGWLEILRFVAKWSRASWTLFSLLYLILFFAFDGYALYSLITIFH